MWKYNYLKWKYNHLKLIVLLSCILLVISHLVVANTKDHGGNDLFEEIWIKLRTWDSEGNEYDPQRQQAILVDKSSILNESSSIRPVM